ncbi:MAG: helix-turn-helix transcriptional regulator [Anaerolineales bacterium]|nr:helix-turn-helix transcriptional regulator [Anaerolineales bacterium]
MERKLLLLGLLRQHDMYGYQINDLIDAHLGTSIHITKPTAYRLLHKMTEDGLVSFHEETVGNRPPRRIYAITLQGELEFQKILKESLSSFKPAEQPSSISLAFLDTLPPEEVLPLLEKRRATVIGMCDARRSDESHLGSFQCIIDHQIRHLQTEIEWLSDVIEQLASEKLGDEHNINLLSPTNNILGDTKK